MNNPNKSEVSPMLKKDIVIYILLGIVFIYLLTGIFPITRFETDSMAIANACEEMIQSGKFEENILGHSYHMQSGTYFLIITLAQAINVSAFTSYSILTVSFALIYWIFLFLLLRKITKLSPWLIIIVLFLFQEIFILSYYANSAVIASAFWIAAFYFLWIRNDSITLIISALLLSLGMWFRIDVAFTYPSVLLLFYLKDKNIKSAVFRSVILGVLVIPLTLFLMYLMNAEVAGFLGYTEYHGELFGSKHNIGLLDLDVVKAHAAYLSVLAFSLVVGGIIILIARKNFVPVFFLISGVFFYYLLGINNTVAPKHLSYFTLFMAMIILFGISYFNNFQYRFRKIIATFIFLLFFIQYIIGLRVDISSIPYQFEEESILNPQPTLLSFGSVNTNKSSLQNINFVIGAGSKISTADELSASSGLLFSPVMWYKQKSGLYDSFNKLSDILENSGNDTIYFNVADGSSQFVINNLLSNGFIWKEKQIDFAAETQLLNFYKDNYPAVQVLRHSVNKNNFEEVIQNILNRDRPDSYLIFIWDWQNYYIKKLQLPVINQLTHQVHGLI